jgi:hypothetical protein
MRSGSRRIRDKASNLGMDQWTKGLRDPGTLGLWDLSGGMTKGPSPAELASGLMV